MVGKWLFNIACVLGILLLSLCLLGSIANEFPIICTIIFSFVLCLWIPKFNSSLIENFFNGNKLSYFFTALVLSFILMVVSVHIGTNSKDSNNTSTTKQVETNKKQTNKKSPEELLWFAKFQCEKEIKARAIYPPSTKVKFRDDKYINGNSYTLYGTVDGQNAFGGMVRQNFGCEIIIDQENDKFWIKDLLIE